MNKKAVTIILLLSALLGLAIASFHLLMTAVNADHVINLNLKVTISGRLGKGYDAYVMVVFPDDSARIMKMNAPKEDIASFGYGVNILSKFGNFRSAFVIILDSHRSYVATCGKEVEDIISCSYDSGSTSATTHGGE